MIMSWNEFTGKTVKEAIARACEELSTDEALLDVEVLEESTRGFLGIVGQRDARIRVRRRDILKEALEAEREPAVRAEEKPLERGDLETEADDFQVVAETEQPKPPEVQEPVLESPHLGEACNVLRDILKLMLVEATVEASMMEGAIYLDIKGDGSGLLIGKKGQTLDALQYMVSKIINKESVPGDKVEIVVDTENYRLRKRENLKEIAVKISQKVKKTLKPASLNPMPPHERRLVHLILADDRDVYTKSYGEGALRRIIVYPRKASASKRRRR
jgi:spoIIIJ-associated protein